MRNDGPDGLVLNWATGQTVHVGGSQSANLDVTGTAIVAGRLAHGPRLPPRAELPGDPPRLGHVQLLPARLDHQVAPLLGGSRSTLISL